MADLDFPGKIRDSTASGSLLWEGNSVSGVRSGLLRLSAHRRRARSCTEAARGRDACLTAVLDVEEAAEDEHNRARGGFVQVDGLTQPAPAPRFSRTPARVDSPPPLPGEHTRSALADWGVPEDAVASLVEAGVLSSIPEPSAEADR
ncbi:CoA transferase [Saccharopolyspora sp. HNM0986]|uniref:CoA transferase n=1 Tax=Saccharopolyspora galaxeae TaxID=2781241 RepID=UPI0019093721|nr:CoA transferase [Saccharopolyspora sp. HNM0986]MBK0870803.1 CoA transferase [Saccharopolyspora sp. HNM0986]